MCFIFLLYISHCAMRRAGGSNGGSLMHSIAISVPYMPFMNAASSPHVVSAIAYFCYHFHPKLFGYHSILSISSRGDCKS